MPRTIIPDADQIFQGIAVRGDHFSWNFGPPDQNFQNFRDSSSERLHWLIHGVQRTKIMVEGFYIIKKKCLDIDFSLGYCYVPLFPNNYLDRLTPF